MSIKDLAAQFEITDSFIVMLTISAEIMTRKFGKGISKAGRPYSYEPEWLIENIQPAVDKYPHKSRQWIASYRTRCRNIIKEGKNFNTLRFFIDFLVERHESEMDIKYEFKNDVHETIKMPTQPKSIELDINPEDIPF